MAAARALPPPDQEPDDRSGAHGAMSFLKHLDELRQRLLVCVAALAVGFVVSWAYVERLLDFIFVPLAATVASGKFQYYEPGEAFMLRMKLAALAGLFLALPVILWQIWRFVAPGLYSDE
jgi:sec-independent protein translocase protein TatC